MKKKLLRWAGLRYSMNKNVNVYTALAMPYNPYHPHQYDRFTLCDLYDLNSYEIRIQDTFWDFLSGNKNTFGELILIYEKVGDELRARLDKTIKNFQ